ncbi:toxin-antitoxin system HicB family antitoxin [Escherichia coli]|uniref:toxin-antitoxin system HicB family antitoxin n=1 Tax=Escherichia coli TaxID=562 RepID=UPI000D12A582|nr:toxin-antitoxin system HicB family antitoxin [Escherichia coli]EED0778358.1 toxin-antitoxin system HicB family antitoxin [Escherichia coli]EEQ1642840.1 toxin-antitoxin system HicB family antitoxin [Escherichia coli]EER3768252.1 toxin-antitoxin system HicB family antitoxin [Escherichia coli]EES0189433.1 toxin-antitoxin system HicB family antitoxin [Escherichia coli]EES3947016.1 toxin-antitoxin system HicB family antitoxin [Escherichia coli]
MQDTLFTERKNIKLNLRLPSRLNEDLRLPSRLNEDLRRLAEMDCISLNSAIVRLLAKGVREEVANGR